MGCCKSLLRDGGRGFDYIEPPFKYNARSVRQYPPEVSGGFLLNEMCRRLDWPSLAGKALLDYGCGVRFTRTILNLGMDIGRYVGVDINREAIDWLKENVKDPRFRFEHVEARNAWYGPDRKLPDPSYLTRFDFPAFDAVCMFSVVTHQDPEEVAVTLQALRGVVKGPLYFTAFIDEGIDGYAELDPHKPGRRSAYHPAALIETAEKAGWTVRALYPKSPFQQEAFLCD